MYTAAQQARLDAAKAQLNAAISSKDSAYNDMSTHYDTYMVNCKYKWSIPAKGETWNSEGCDSGVNANQHPGCGSKQSCQSRVGEQNGKVAGYNATLPAVVSAQANYDKVLKEITAELENDPDTQSAIASAQATAQSQGSVTLVKWVIFGAVLFILAAGFVYYKFIRKVAGSGTATA